MSQYEEIPLNFMLNEHDIRDYALTSPNQPERTSSPSSANDIQIAGDHYKRFKGHEPWDVITAWGLGYLEGTALKYIARWQHKGGVEDLRKAGHFIQKAIEVYEKNVK